MPKTSGDPPCPRDQCAVGIVGSKLVLFGGRTYGARLCDLWTFDLDVLAWEQCAAAGTVPPPRQGAAAALGPDGRLWVHGGASHFVLDDLHAYDFQAEEWAMVALEGRRRPARVGHAMAFHSDGQLRMFGGVDQLGLPNWTMWRLQKHGASKYEWIETIFHMQPNRSRCCLFSGGKLNCIQVGHPLHNLPASKEAIAGGHVIYDIFQTVALDDLPDKPLTPQDLLPGDPKRDRIALTLNERHSNLPLALTAHSPREAAVLAHAAAFSARWAVEHPWRPVPWLVAANECGVDKLVCTTLRRATLPHTELHDLEGVCRWLGEFFTYEPLTAPGKPPPQLASPAAVLQWQAGDSFDLATLAASVLLGAGYNALVMLGYTSRAVALGDQSHLECPQLLELGMQPPCYADLPEAQQEMEEDPEAEAAAAAAAQAAARAAAEAAAQAAAEAAAQAAAEAEAAAAEAAALVPSGQPLDSIVEDVAAARAGRGGVSRPTTSKSTKKVGASRPSTGVPTRGASPAKFSATGGSKQRQAGAKPDTGTKPGAATEPAAAAQPGNATVRTKGQATGTSIPSSRTPSRPATSASRPATGASKALSTARPESGRPGGTGKRGLAAAKAEPARPPATVAAAQPAELEATANAQHTDTGAAEAQARPALDVAPDDCCTGSEDQAAPAPCLLPPMRPRRYVHAFVVVRSGRRGVTSALVIDPATGNCWPTAEAPCISVEYAWDDSNYYCNLQQVAGEGSVAGSLLLPGTTSSRLPPLDSTDWNLHNPNAWAALLPVQQAEGTQTSTAATELSSWQLRPSQLGPLRAGGASSASVLHSQSAVAVMAGSSSLAAGVSALSAASRQFTPRGEVPVAMSGLDRHKSVALHMLTARSDAPPPLAGAHTWSAEGLSSLVYLAPNESSAPLAGSRTQLAAAGRPVPAAALAGLRAVAGPEMPPSWVPRLSLSREALDVRCSRGAKLVVYRQAHRQLFAVFGECARWDGMVERVTACSDPDCASPECIVELFQRRRDHLERRESWPMQRRVLETFGAGTMACLMRTELIKQDPVRRELAFFHDHRADALMRRVEVLGVSMEEFFAPRPDRLASRRVLYSTPVASPETTAAQRNSNVMRRTSLVAARAATAGTGRVRRPSVIGTLALEAQVTKVTECYRMEEPVVPAVEGGQGEQGQSPLAATAARNSCITKRTFWLERREVKVVIGDPNGGVIHRKYAMDEPKLLEGSQACALTEEEAVAEWSALHNAAKHVEARVRSAAEESEGVFAARRLQEQSVQLVTSHTDAARVKVEDSADGMAGDDDECGWDVLARYLPHTGTRDMTEAEAACAREACLEALRERLAERERLVACRVEEEGAELARLQGVLVTERHRMGAADLARVEEQAEAAQFRLSVARRRQGGHAAHAAERVEELRQRLAADKRLTAAASEGGGH